MVPLFRIVQLHKNSQTHSAESNISTFRKYRSGVLYTVYHSLFCLNVYSRDCNILDFNICDDVERNSQGVVYICSMKHQLVQVFVRCAFALAQL